MLVNPFSVTKAEGFNHSYQKLASLMEFKSGVADILLSNTNVFLDGSRGSGKSMYLRLLSLPVKSQYERLAESGQVERLPLHSPYLGVYLKLAPTIFGPHEYENQPRFRELFQQLVNIYSIEQMVITLIEGVSAGVISLEATQERTLARQIVKLALADDGSAVDLPTLATSLRSERRRIRQALNILPFSPDQRSQPDLLWDVAEEIVKLEQFNGMRVHLLLDEYDSLSFSEQRIPSSCIAKTAR